jgi:hypothetical protein
MSTPFYIRPTRRLPGNHDPALSLPGFETEQMAEERRIKIARMMIRLGQGPSLVSCCPASPCGSAACPACNRHFRRWLIHRGMWAFKDCHSSLVTVSAVHHSLSRPAGELQTLDLENAKRQFARHLERAGLGGLNVIGGIDFSFNEHQTNAREPHWQAHFYVICQGEKREAIKEALSNYYKATPSIPRPIRTRNVHTLMLPLSYAFKSVFFRRATYLADNGRWTSKGYPLKTTQLAELIAFLDQYKPTDRLFLRNIRREGSSLIIKGRPLR